MVKVHFLNVDSELGTKSQIRNSKCIEFIVVFKSLKILTLCGRGTKRSGPTYPSSN